MSKIPRFIFRKLINKFKFPISFFFLVVASLVWLFVSSEKDDQGEKKIISPDFSSSDLVVDFLDVGKADCAVIYDDNHVIIIDGGLRSSKLSVVDYIKDNVMKHKKKDINLMVLTHPHSDHYGQLADVLNAFSVNRFITPNCKVDLFDHKGYEYLMKKLNQKRDKIKIDFINPKSYLLSGKMDKSKESEYHFQIGRIKIDILGPIKIDDKKTNNNSIVLKLTFKGVKFLFTGDAEKEEEKDLINSRQDLSADVLKLGHHGSKTSSSMGFLKKVHPKFAVASAGNHYDKIAIYPQKEVKDRLNLLGIPYFVTKDLGTIRFVVTSQGELKEPLIEKKEAA